MGAVDGGTGGNQKWSGFSTTVWTKLSLPGIAFGLGFRLFFLVYYLFDGFGRLTTWLDVGLDWTNVDEIGSEAYYSYPPLTLLAFWGIKALSFGNFKAFVAWAGALELAVTLSFYFVCRRYLTSFAFRGSSPFEALVDLERGRVAMDEGQRAVLRWVYAGFVVNPLWLVKEVFGTTGCGYHMSDSIFLLAFLAALWLYTWENKGPFYLALAVSVVIKWFTLPAVALLPLKYLLERNYRELAKFGVIVGSVVVAFLVLPFFVLPGYKTLLDFWVVRGGRLEGTDLPLHLRVVPIVVTFVLYCALRLRKASVLEIAFASVAVMFTFMAFSKPYLRYLLALTFAGHLSYDESVLEVPVPVLLERPLKVDSVLFTLGLSVLGLGVSVVLLWRGLLA
ncbi:MAG: hypothetical protein Kow0069_11680 [Promethearchaeota archaeon]